MNRRTAINNVGLIVGATILSTDLFLSCKDSKHIDNEYGKDRSALDEFSQMIAGIGHIILPPSEKHLGFKAINDNATTMSILRDCYKKDDSAALIKGLTEFALSIQSTYKKTFDELTDVEKNTIVSDLDKRYFSKEINDVDKPRFYGILKEAILLTYFTNKKILEGSMSYTKVPGKYDGALKVNKNAYSVVYGLGI